MPYQWTAERERLMLLLAVSSCNLKPSADTWAAVASLLGEGLTPSAVSQKYYKLRKESVKLCSGNALLTPPTTPSKRKAPSDDDNEMKQPTPMKRAKKPVLKEEDIDGELCSTFSSSSPGQSDWSYPAYQMPYVPEHFPRYVTDMPARGVGLESNGFLLGGDQNQV